MMRSGNWDGEEGASPRDYTEPDTWEAPRPGLIFSGTIKNFLPPFLHPSLPPAK